MIFFHVFPQTVSCLHYLSTESTFYVRVLDVLGLYMPSNISSLSTVSTLSTHHKTGLCAYQKLVYCLVKL